MTNSVLTLADEVANMTTRLRQLEKQTRDDAALIELITQQKDALSEELASAKHDFGVEIYAMTKVRDEALKKAADVKAIIETICQLGLQGINKMEGEKARPTHAASAPVNHTIPEAQRMPQASQGLEDLNSRPLFLEKPVTAFKR